MLWKEIVKKYPNQRVALANIVWKDKDHGLIISADVVASEQDGFTKRDIVSIAIKSNGNIKAESTSDGFLQIITGENNGNIF